MKRYFFILLLWFCVGQTLSGAFIPQTGRIETPQPSVSLQSRLESLPGVTEAVKMSDPGVFAEKFEVMFRQPLDHENPAAGEFDQRFYLLYRGMEKPVVFVTEGYRGSYAANPRFTNELAERYQANIIVVEHRYFERSTPEPKNWDYLTVSNSMGDLHRIREAMKPLFTGKWIATGISKGGQTAIMYAAYYPDEADVYVPYVAPVCFGIEDGRHEPFIERRCGTPKDRARVRAFQREALERRREIQPLFEKFCEEKGLKFRIPVEEVYDFCVLEYSFAFWQWGTSPDQIPAPGSDARTLFEHLEKVAGPDYFSIGDEPSFYVQALRELGYYGYDTRPFRGLLRISGAGGYLRRIMLPEEAQRYEFSRRVSGNIYKYLKHNDPKMICVNGEFDPWNAVSLDKKIFRGKRNMLLMVADGGSHRTRISTLSPDQQAEVWRRIDRWMAE